MIIRCLNIGRNPVSRQKTEEFIQSFRDDFQVQTVAGINAAVDAIAAADVSLILCELPLMLNGGLVACILDKKPTVPLLIIGSEDSPHFTRLSALNCVKGFISPRAQPAEFAGKVVCALDELFYQGNVRSVSCGAFIQLLEQGQSDCMLRVINSEEVIEGLLFFKRGRLIDAACGTLEAREAVKRMLAWQSMELALYNICPLRKDRIDAPTAMFILKGQIAPELGGRPTPAAEMKTSLKSIKKPVGGLAGLYLSRAKKNK